MNSAKTGHKIVAAPFGAVLLGEESGVLAAVDLMPLLESSTPPRNLHLEIKVWLLRHEGYGLS